MKIRFRLFSSFFLLLFLHFPLYGQHTANEIHYLTMDLYALRYLPLPESADSIVTQVINKSYAKKQPVNQKTDLRFSLNREFSGKQVSASDLYDLLGKQNVDFLLEETLGDVDLFQAKNDLLLLFFKAPLAKENTGDYQYRLAGKRELNGRQVYEIVFYPKQLGDKAFTGCLYVTADGNYQLYSAYFTLDSSWKKNILLTQTFETKADTVFPLKKEYLLSFGDNALGNLLVDKTVVYTNEEIEAPALPEISSTRAVRNAKNLLHIVLTDHITLGGRTGWVEWGPVSQTVSYNEIEGLRLKAGGNTTLRLNRQWLAGGYIAYGFKDQKFKYRGDLIYSFLPKDKELWEFPKRLLSVSYIHDLNLPGQDLLTSNRDYFLYSFSHSATRNLFWQKLFAVHYEQELPSRFSFQVGGQQLQYQGITSSELNFALRYAPHELFLQNRNKRLSLRRGTVELNFSHRIGLKGIFGSDCHYQITNLEAAKRLYFPQNTGTADIRLSAGKIWNQVPFPLLYVPAGNQSYVFVQEDYNLMDYYEFTTDQFVACNIHFLFNVSPLGWLFENRIKTSVGFKAIYGPASEKNRFPSALGRQPYMEMNIGFTHIFNVLRIEWVQRLTYLDQETPGDRKNRGALFLGAGFAF